MPSLHCHLPPEEEEKRPEQDDVIDLGEEVAAPSGTEEEERDENAPITRSDDDEEENDSTDNAIDDTSSEASSMLNDPTIQQWVPVVSSSDENESEGSGFWTPPSTLEEDFDDVDVNTGIRRGFQRRNTARRSRGRRPGVFYVRRGRHRQPLSEQEWYRLTPFERGLTFNGFARNLEPETVTDHMVEDFEEILYKVKWRNLREAKFIESSVMRAYKPDMVVDYWESNVRRRSS